MALPVLILCGLGLQACTPHSSHAGEAGRGAGQTYVASGLSAPQMASLDEALRYSEAHRGSALLVLRDGIPVLERYAEGIGPNTAFKLASGTKSFWGVAALAAVADGLIRLDEPVATTLTEWANDPLRRTITVRQLLTFTSGLEPGEKVLRRTSDLYRDALSVPMVAAPGQVFTYGPSHLAAFGAFLQRRLGRGETPLTYLTRRVFDPIGMPVADWHLDPQGHPIMAAGAAVTARAWGQFGQFLLDRGRVGGSQIIPARLMADLIQPSAINPLYGLTVWLNNSLPAAARDRVTGIRMFKHMEDSGQWGAGSPPDLFMAAGAGNQRLYILPSQRMVVVRLAEHNDKDWDDGAFLRLLLLGRA